MGQNAGGVGMGAGGAYQMGAQHCSAALALAGFPSASGEAKPKRPMSAYLLFCQKHRDQIVKENVRSAPPSRCGRQPLLTDQTSA